MSSPVRVYYEADSDRARLRDRVFAIIGYGSQGSAHAQNLRDSGARVIVGLRPGGASWQKATADGLEVRPVADAARAGDVIMMLVPDQEQRAVYESAVAPALEGKTLMFAHGFNIHFGEIKPPAGVDVSMIAPSLPVVSSAANTRQAVACRGWSRSIRTPAARRFRTPSPTRRASVAPAPASLRRRSPRKPKRICSVSRRCCAAV
jgi:hypothetical protein